MTAQARSRGSVSAVFHSLFVTRSLAPLPFAATALWELFHLDVDDRRTDLLGNFAELIRNGLSLRDLKRKYLRGAPRR